ncbi:GNAT family N-acetyltransferase [Magnetospirillum moscoviense]|uniref:N-acetyltransferase domain-containing protein n=1 Tax=Magnetospirillum moscoviense TaxID=1437059 RepID=A0A178MZ22_9PROT|nr:GNAT family N-acetyltransferase [Magnetospirillum moscoviense]OAN63186.1 hypothetical protein A6A05_06450 [Magnetospirillum moscoviense]
MLIRKLLPDERPDFAFHLKGLAPADRRFRFAHGTVSDDWIDTYVGGIDPDDLILGVFDGPRLVGAAHVAFSDAVAEVGVSVDPAHRSAGIGAELFKRAIRWARNRGAERLYTLCLADNRAMIRLAGKLGMEVTRDSGTAEAYLALDPPDLLTVADEMSSGLDTIMTDWTDAWRACHRALLPGGKI